jgi:hypothetical protein
MRRILICALLLSAVQAWGSGWQVANPIQKGRLVIYPVLGSVPGIAEKYLTLDEGLEAGTIKVGEMGTLVASRMMRTPGMVGTAPVIRDASRVNELALVNNSDRPLLLLAGEIVSGGKQDRVVSRDRIVPPHSEPVPLGVFCVEPGRWRGLSMEFAAAKLMAHPELRKQAVDAQDQQKVWAEVAASRSAMTVTVDAAAVGGVAERVAVAPTSSYAGTAKASPVEHKIEQDTSSFLPKLPDDAVGMVVAVDGRIVWADVFPNAALFRRYRAKLLQSYVVESYRVASASAGAPSPGDVEKFLRPLGGRQNIEVEPGLYRLVRSEADGLVTFELESLAEKGTPRLHFARMVK